MSALDDALQKFIDEPETGQEPYYDEVLNTDFYIPLMEAPDAAEPQDVAPMVLESEGKNYLMLFDSEERLNAWAQEDAHHAIYAGHQLAELTPEDICWAVNVGCEYAKEILPEEIGWLKQAVVSCREQEETEQ